MSKKDDKDARRTTEQKTVEDRESIATSAEMTVVCESLLSSATELAVLLETLRIMKSRKYLAPDKLEMPNETPFNLTPLVEMRLKKTALRSAGTILNGTAGQLLLQQEDRSRRGTRANSYRQFTEALFDISRRWALCRSGNSIFGDLSLANRELFGHATTPICYFELRPQCDVKSANSADENNEDWPLQVILPHELRKPLCIRFQLRSKGMISCCLVLFFFQGDIKGLQLSFTDGNGPEGCVDVIPAATVSKGSAEKSWIQAIENAQESLICRQFFLAVLRCIHAQQVNVRFPHAVSGLALHLRFFEDFNLSMSIVERDDAPPQTSRQLPAALTSILNAMITTFCARDDYAFVNLPASGNLSLRQEHATAQLMTLDGIAMDQDALARPAWRRSSGRQDSTSATPCSGIVDDLCCVFIHYILRARLHVAEREFQASVPEAHIFRLEHAPAGLFSTSYRIEISATETTSSVVQPYRFHLELNRDVFTIQADIGVALPFNMNKEELIRLYQSGFVAFRLRLVLSLSQSTGWDVVDIQRPKFQPFEASLESVGPWSNAVISLRKPRSKTQACIILRLFLTGGTHLMVSPPTPGLPSGPVSFLQLDDVLQSEIVNFR